MDKRITNSNWNRPLGIVLNQPKRKTGILFGPPPKGKDARSPLNMGEMRFVGRYSLHSFMGQSIGTELYMQFIASEVEWRLKEKSQLEIKPLRIRSQMTYKAGKFLHKCSPFGEAAIFNYQAIWPDLMNPNPTIRINEETEGKFKYELSDPQASFPDVERFSLVGEEWGLPHITYWTGPSGHGGIFWDFRTNRFLSSKLIWQVRPDTLGDRSEAVSMLWEECKPAVYKILGQIGLRWDLNEKVNEGYVYEQFYNALLYVAGCALLAERAEGLSLLEFVGDGSKWFPSAKAVMDILKKRLITVAQQQTRLVEFNEEKHYLVRGKHATIVLSEQSHKEEILDFVKKEMTDQGVKPEIIGRTMEAIKLKRNGDSDAKIAKELGISEETVRIDLIRCNGIKGLWEELYLK